jgi:hypothetical protein
MNETMEAMLAILQAPAIRYCAVIRVLDLVCRLVLCAARPGFPCLLLPAAAPCSAGSTCLGLSCYLRSIAVLLPETLPNPVGLLLPGSAALPTMAHFVLLLCSARSLFWRS